MEIPDPALAVQRLVVPPFGQLLRFDPYALMSNRRRDESFSSLADTLQKEGCHRNVLLLNNDGQLKWIVSDYDQYTITDSFISVEPSEKHGKVVGQTFQGHIFEIDLSDGSLNKIGWTK